MSPLEKLDAGVTEILCYIKQHHREHDLEKAIHLAANGLMGIQGQIADLERQRDGAIQENIELKQGFVCLHQD